MKAVPPRQTAGLKTSNWRFSPGIRTRLVIAILLVTLTVSLIGLVLNAQRDMVRARQVVIENLITRLAAMKVDFVAVLTDQAPESAIELVDELNIYDDIHHIVLRDNNENVVFRYNFHNNFHGAEDHKLPDFIAPDQSSAIIYSDDNILMHHTVMYGGMRYGWVSIWIDAVDVKQQYKTYTLTALLLMIGAFLITLVLAALAGHYFSRPILNLVKFIRYVSHHHDFSRRLVTGQKGEIGDLYDGVNVMLDEIAVAEDEIRRLNESRLHGIIESSMDGVISINSDGEITFWSRHAEKIFGWSSKEALGRLVTETIIPERFRQQHEDGIQKLVASSKKRLLNRRLLTAGLHQDGHEVPVEISLSAVRIGDGWVFNAFVRDLTEQKIAEKEKRDMQSLLLRNERLATVGQLTATVAHELRNPMGTIQNSLYMLTGKLTVKSPDTDGLIERINRNIRRCDTIISELLDFTRDRDLMLVPTVIDSWLVRLLDGYDWPDGVELVRHLATGARVFIDTSYIESAVTNILNNAVQAAVEKHPGHGRIEVETVFEKGRLGMVISDNGAGIAAEDSERVFEPLYSTRVYGVGLGLPAVKKIMDRHGGEVSMDSSPGGGVRVTLWLKMDRPS
jgi:PAS domain S-box-containing protein